MAEYETDALYAFAERLPINQMPGNIAITTPDSKYVCVNDYALNLIGYHSHEQIVDTSYDNMPCMACEDAERFRQEDSVALGHELKILSYHFYEDWKLFLGVKKPIIVDNQVVGLFTQFTDITRSRLINLSRFLPQVNGKIQLKQFTYTIQDQLSWHGLTKKEQLCLFYLLRGYSYKEIASKINRGITTVQTHLEHIRVKLGVHNRSQCVERAIELGLHCQIPVSLIDL